jgi:hypothetical protein
LPLANDGRISIYGLVLKRTGGGVTSILIAAGDAHALIATVTWY